MAISPPSDLLLDVAAAADPMKVRAATERLAKLAADPTAPNAGFDAALTRARSGFGSSMPGAAVAKVSETTPDDGSIASVGSAGPGAFAHRPGIHSKPSAYTKFEAVLLQNFVEAMLPKDSELFGDKNSASAYRSMMAEQIANELANAGGIGVAKAIEAAHPATGSATKAATTPHKGSA